GGHLLLNSRPGQGARFDVLLPEMDAATRVAVPRVEGGGTAVGKLHGRVGVVDDDPLVCEFLTDCLRQWGLEVSAWSDAEQARTASDRKSTRLNSSHVKISYAVFCLKKKKKNRK